MTTIYLLNKAEFEREAAYIYAVYGLDLLYQPGMQAGELTYPLYGPDGRRLTTLDEAVRALEAGEVCPVRPEWLGAM